MRERDRRDFVPIISCLSAAVLVLYWQSWQLRTFRVRGWWQGRYKTIKSYRAFWQVLRLLVRFHYLVQLFVFAKRGKSQPQIYKLSMSFSATAKPPTESQSACQTSSPPQGTAHYISYTCFDGYQIEKLPPPPIPSRKRRKRQCLITDVSRPLPSSHRRGKKRRGVLGIRSTSLFCCDHVSGSPFPSSSSS